MSRIPRTLMAILMALGVALSSLLIAPVAASAAPAAPAASPKAVKAKAKKPFFNNCRKNRRFSERRFDYDLDAVLAGRCATSRIKGIHLVSSYSGHSPTASKALDFMVNMKGSCRAGRDTGNRLARYMMNNAHKHGVQYIIWKNSYWSASSRPTKWRNWRHGMSGGSCTTRHFDHVHVSFK